jgi:hypothetical protein
MKDPVEEKSELIIDILRYAHENKLDIRNRNDVKAILEELNPSHSEDIDDCIELLKSADAYMDMTTKEKETEKTNLPN